MNPKVLLVANTDWYLYRFRLTLARHLVSQGYQVKMVSPSGPYVSRLIDQGFEWLEWGVERQSVSPIGELRSLWQLTELYATEKPTIVHHHTIKPVLYGSFAATKTGVPAIINSITGSGFVFMSNEIKARI